ncbi:hypothetical protein F5883DRAFT_205133 [Diaporthe sp. PMI_573]|nr:hypothetical protein F5883DRAFT_205133 [Diaporthaceae sp. PMI_573]
MEEELEKLRQQLWNEQRRREEEQRRREEAEGRVLEEQQYRREAEELARSSRPLTLENYLEACHSLNRAIQVVTDRSLTTQGETTNPAGRIFPRRIIPWDGAGKERCSVEGVVGTVRDNESCEKDIVRGLYSKN